MLYIVIERFKPGAAREIYRRAGENGRMLPEGLLYVSSWVDYDFKTCYQLMDTEDASLFDDGIRVWKDLADFEIVPVRTSAETARAIDDQE